MLLLLAHIDRLTIDGAHNRPERSVGADHQNGRNKAIERDPSPASRPTAAEHQSVAAVLRPRTLRPSLKITPRKPMPETT
jgi:hypothetical protein